MKGLPVGALTLALLAQVACTGLSTGSNRPAAEQPQQAAVATASPAPTSSPSADGSGSPLLTNSGISLGMAGSALSSSARPPQESVESELKQFQAANGTSLLVPSAWQRNSPATISQSICADSRCVAVDETIQIFTSSDGDEAVGLVSISLPRDGSVDASSLLPGAIRGAVAALSAAAGGANITDGPAVATVTNARRALSATASLVDPSTGASGSMTVVAAAGDSEIDALLIGATEGYQRDHQDYLNRIRASFRMGGPTQ
jgi:hypothetical protein